MYKKQTIQQLKALGEVHRLRVLELLNQGGRHTATQLLAQLPNLSQPSLSRHLKVLREASLVTESKEGREVWYGSVANPMVQALLENLEHMSKKTYKDEASHAPELPPAEERGDSSFQEWLD